MATNRNLRDGPAQDSALVSRKPHLVAGDPIGKISRRAPRAASPGYFCSPTLIGTPFMLVEDTAVEGVKIITPKKHGDEREFFSELQSFDMGKRGTALPICPGQSFAVDERRRHSRPPFPDRARRSRQAGAGRARPHSRRGGRSASIVADIRRHVAVELPPRIGGSCSCRSVSPMGSASWSPIPRSFTRSRILFGGDDFGLAFDDPDSISTGRFRPPTPCCPTRIAGGRACAISPRHSREF